MKKISSEQIKYITDIMFDCNIPVKAFKEVSAVFQGLPEELSPVIGTPLPEELKNNVSSQ